MLDELLGGWLDLVPNALVQDSISAASGLILLTAILQMWRRSLTASIRLLALQGVALSGLFVAIGVAEHEPELVVLAVLALAVKGVVLPWTLNRTAEKTGVVRDLRPLMNPTAGVLAAAALTGVAYLVSQPLGQLDQHSPARAVAVGMALVLIGFLELLSHRAALAQLTGFVVIDNGITTVALLTAGGLPLIVELGVMLDVLLVVLILRVLTARIREAYGTTDLDDLKELRD